MDQAIVVQGLGKRFPKRGVDRPTSLKEAVLHWRPRAPVEQFWGLRDLSFNVARGCTVGVIGRNGAGKSTLLRLIGGVIRPDEGALAVHGRVGGLLDLGAGLTDDLTGRENIFLSGVIAGMTRAEVRARFDEILSFAELESVVDEPIRTYSSGMRMRLAFAVAAHVDPEILLIDEVLAVGDSAFQRKCLERIARFKAAGCTILIVSHDTAQMRALCDEAALLRQGRLLAFGPPDEVIDQYDALLAGGTISPSRAEAPDRPLPGGGRLAMGRNRFGSQQVTIEAVRMLNAEGRRTHCIVAGEGLVVELDYDAKAPAPAPKASVAVHRPDGAACFDTNTATDGLEMPTLAGKGVLRLRIDRLDLCGGNYVLSVGLYEQDWDHLYDFHQLAYPLQVIGANTGKGVMNPPHRWELVAAARGPVAVARGAPSR